MTTPSASSALARRSIEGFGLGTIDFVRVALVWLVITACVTVACTGPAAEQPASARPAATSESGIEPAPVAPIPTPLVSPPPTPPSDPSSLPCTSVVRIEVRKHDRFLEVWCGGGGLRRFPIALSREPVGAKSRRGDRRIPEGDYHIAGSARPSRFHLFIPIDYPSSQDAERGVEERAISTAVQSEILAAHAAGRLPPQDTALGGWVGFHGEGENWRGDLDLDWTDGCIAMRDDAIGWLAEHARRGTPVRILP